jgi:hypothetical protein
MKSLHYFASFAVLALALSASAFARDHNSGTVNLSDTTRVGSTELAPGDYKVEWNGPADDVKINFLQHGKTVATTEGHIKDLPARAPYNAVAVKTLDDNSKALDEIQFDNRTEALAVGN